MQLLTPLQLKTLRPWFLPERPGPLVGLHVLQTGNGVAFADRWPNPQALVINTAGNYTLLGQPEAMVPADLSELVQGFVEAPPAFLPLLQATFGQVEAWPRVILELPAEPAAGPGKASNGPTFRLSSVGT
jgi:hypothetical protein